MREAVEQVERQADLLRQLLAARAHRARPRGCRAAAIGSAMARAAVKRGLRLSVGSWNTIWMRLRCGEPREVLAGSSPISSPSNTMVPAVCSSSRITIIEVVDLPQPDSPTRPTLSPRLTVEADAIDRAEDRVSGGGFGRTTGSDPVLLARKFLDELVDNREAASPTRPDRRVAEPALSPPPSSSGSRSRSDTPGRGVARISRRV